MDEFKPSKPLCVIKQFFSTAKDSKSILKATELFEQEAVRLETLGKHPQIPELFAHLIQDDRQYLVQEYIAGQNLAEELATEGVFSEIKIRELLNEILPILEFVHNHQVIHRDIKPENIVRLANFGEGENQKYSLVLVNFGAAKFTSKTALVKTGTVIGSAAYIAPEQVRGKAIFASDIYSLAITCIYHQTKEIVPKDVVFLMDTSGSQSGAPLAQSKVLMRRFLQGLNPNDTFTIIDFANSAQTLSTEPLANTPANQKKAIDYVNNLKANGGTELLNGFETVLNFSPAKNGRLRSIVLVTDGLIGNENQIISRIQKQLQPGNRLYSFGVGSSVNRFLLNRLAEVGRGTVHVVRHDESVDAVVEKFFNEINNPVLTNIEVTWQGLGEAPEIFPLKPADLFAQEPLILYGRKQDRLSGNLQITAVAAGGKPYRKTFPLRFDSDGGNEAIAQLWGRAKIKELMLEMSGGEMSERVDAVTNVALGYRLMSKYTAFVAVSDEQRVDPNNSSREEVKKQTPDGMVGIPEPSFVWAILLFGLYMGWKHWVQDVSKAKKLSENS